MIPQHNSADANANRKQDQQHREHPFPGTTQTTLPNKVNKNTAENK
jgi:hypothetical protein